MENGIKISNMETNIISWYPFEENANILQIDSETDLDVINNEVKYDYIFVKGLEYIIYKDENYIEKCKEKLKENGKLLITFDNKLAIKFISKISKGERFGIHENKKTMTLREVEKLLDKARISK